MHGSSEAESMSNATESLSTGRYTNRMGELDVEGLVQNTGIYSCVVFYTKNEHKGVAGWLGSLGLEDHQAEFRSNQINGVALLLLDEQDLRNMGVDKVSTHFCLIAHASLLFE
jgi:hypothetical protein